MRILSNDYLSNVPHSGIETKGGPPRFAQDFAQYVQENGHEWHGLVSVKEGTHREDSHTDGAVHFHYVEEDQMNFQAFESLQEGNDWRGMFEDSIARTEKLLKNIHPDVVFLNGFSVSCWILASAARRQALPLVIQHAGIFIKEVDIYNDLFSAAARNACAHMESEVACAAAVNIFLNEYSRHVFEALLPLTAQMRSVIVPLPHANWSFETTFAPTPGDRRVLGVVARWDRIKNHDAILRLAEEISRQGLHWKLRVVTNIPQTAARAEFKARYKSAVEVVAPMDRDSLKLFYRSVDALVLPSHFDVSPTVVMEALSEGKPTLISPQVGWVSEYTAALMQDWIIDFEDAELVVERLKKQFARAAWTELGHFASTLQAQHSPRTVYASYLQLFIAASKS